MANDDKHVSLKEDAAARAKDIRRDAVGILKWAFVIYPVCILTGLIGGGIGAGLYAGAHFGFILTTLSAIAGVAVGGAVGFYAAAAIISGLVGDLIFDAGWQGSKIGWKTLRGHYRKKDDAS